MPRTSAKPTKEEAEPIIRHLVHVWFAEAGLTAAQREHPSFLMFKSWIDAKGYSSYLSFHSTAGAHNDAYNWFNQEMKQTWRD